MPEVMALLVTLFPFDRAFLTQFLLHFNEILSIQFSNHFYRFPWRVVVLKINRKKDRYDVQLARKNVKQYFYKKLRMMTPENFEFQGS